MISVIVPIYNVEKYIDDCLNSLTRQSNKNFELILVNDGSQDRSMEKVQHWLTQLENTVVINQSNGGLSAARNTGLEKATGDYILFLDSDDMLSIDAIEILASTIEDTDADMILYSAGVFGDGNVFQESNFNHDSYSRCSRDYPESMRGVEYLDCVVGTNKFIVSACMYAFKRELVSSLRFINGIIHEDNHFTPALLISSEKVKLLDDKLYKRRVREGSITTTTVSTRNIEGYFYSARGLENEFTSKFSNGSHPVYISVLKRLYQATLATALKTRKPSIILYWCHLVRYKLDGSNIHLDTKFRLLIKYPRLVTFAWLSAEFLNKIKGKFSNRL